MNFPRLDVAPADKLKVLLIRTSALGDIILTSHIGKYLKELYPNFHLTWLTEAQYQELHECMPWFDDLLLWDRKGRSGGFKELIGEVKKRKFDILFNVQDNDRTALLSFRSGISKKIGYHRHAQFIYNDNVYKVLGELGIPLYPQDRERTLACPRVDVPMLPEKTDGRTRIVLAVGASSERKCWPTASWKQLLAHLCSLNIHVVLTGAGDRECAVASEIAEGAPESCVTNLTGRLSLLQLIKTLDSADAVVACDTGPLHIAKALGKKVVGLFGPTTLATAYMKSLDKTVFAECGAAGCLDYSCKRACMETISVQSVIKALSELVQKV